MKTEIVLKRLVLICFLFFFFLQLEGVAQNKPTRGWFYTSFGWHRIYYTNSTIHFQNNTNPNFDFRLIKAKAIDDNDLAVGKGHEPPQWSIRLGYLINNKKQTGMELSYDHAKYVLKQGQTLRLIGTINGIYYDKDTLIHRDFIEYEHTDGANYYMFSLVKRIQLQKKSNHILDLLCKAGAGLVIPRTDSKMFGFSYDKRYHISGYVAGLEGNLRYELIKNLFAELSTKVVFARYGDVLLYGEGRAKQQWLSGQLLFTLAYQIPNKSY